MKTLYIFTNHYPYSATSECFLEDEMEFLSKAFKTIVIIPMKGSDTVRKVPDNCKVTAPLELVHSRFKYFFYGLFSFKTCFYLARDFFSNKVYQSKKRFRAWGASAKFINNFANRKVCKDITKNIKSDDVVYFYWGIGQNVLSILLKGRVHSVSRFHGEWDLWEERYGNYGALRTYIMQSLDVAVSISKKGKQFLKQKYPFGKVIYSPLGTNDYGTRPPSPQDGIIRVISCSHIYPLKRVPLIFQSLNHTTSIQIEWTHIGEGDGNCMEELIEMIKREGKEHLKVVLADTMSHEQVMEYYKTHYFDLFINLSTSEGVPVAIMEALSFGIPVIATDVGGTSDEVNEQTGILLSANPSVQEVSHAILSSLDMTFHPRQFWENHYSSKYNYSNFAKLLSEL